MHGDQTSTAYMLEGITRAGLRQHVFLEDMALNQKLPRTPHFLHAIDGDTRRAVREDARSGRRPLPDASSSLRDS